MRDVGSGAVREKKKRVELVGGGGKGKDEEG